MYACHKGRLSGAASGRAHIFPRVLDYMELYFHWRSGISASAEPPPHPGLNLTTVPGPHRPLCRGFMARKGCASGLAGTWAHPPIQRQTRQASKARRAGKKGHQQGSRNHRHHSITAVQSHQNKNKKSDLYPLRAREGRGVLPITLVLDPQATVLTCTPHPPIRACARTSTPTSKRVNSTKGSQFPVPGRKIKK